MNKTNVDIYDESGSITIIAAIMVLLIVTLIGISAMNTTTVELQIAGNDQLSRIAFYNADSGVYGIPKIISRIIDTSDPVGIAAETDSIAPGVNGSAVGAGKRKVRLAAQLLVFITQVFEKTEAHP